MYIPFLVSLFSNCTTSLSVFTDLRNSRHGLTKKKNNNNDIQII